MHVTNIQMHPKMHQGSISSREGAASLPPFASHWAPAGHSCSRRAKKTAGIPRMMSSEENKCYRMRSIKSLGRFLVLGFVFLI